MKISKELQILIDQGDWSYISKYQKLSENFIREFQGKVNWNWISKYQKLSENFIREFQGKVNWICISKYQKLSENFIREFQGKVDWNWISKYQKLSPKFRKEFNLKVPENSWLYAREAVKLKKLKELGLYTLSKDNKSLTAYKAVRPDGHSLFNFQYKYESNKSYKSHCDCNLNEDNSFGLSAWTETKAKEYGSGQQHKIIQVKIQVKDIGAIVHDGGKIRCRKFKVV